MIIDILFFSETKPTKTQTKDGFRFRKKREARLSVLSTQRVSLHRRRRREARRRRRRRGEKRREEKRREEREREEQDILLPSLAQKRRKKWTEEREEENFRVVVVPSIKEEIFARTAHSSRES